jgi:hypothetical protein
MGWLGNLLHYELAVRDAKLAGLVDLKYFCHVRSDCSAARRLGTHRSNRDREKAHALRFHQLKGVFHSEDASPPAP